MDNMDNIFEFIDTSSTGIDILKIGATIHVVSTNKYYIRIGGLFTDLSTIQDMLDDVTSHREIDIALTDIEAQLILKEDKINKGAVLGYAELDTSGVIPIERIPVDELPAATQGDIDCGFF